MNHAQQLLQSGKHSVSAVGLKLGFSTTSNFIRAYKEVLGITPGDGFSLTQKMPKTAITNTLTIS